MSVQDQTDAELLAACATEAGEQAFRELAVRHAGMVRAVALRKLGREDEADEVAQEVLTILARKGRRSCGS